MCRLRGALLQCCQGHKTLKQDVARCNCCVSTARIHQGVCCRGAAEAFQQNDAKVAKFKDVLPAAATWSYELLLHGTVAKDMDAIFRRSEVWAKGVEHLHLLTVRKGCSAADAAEYVQLLAQVAETDAGRAVQSVAGEAALTACAESADGGAQALHASSCMQAVSHAMMSRFHSVEELKAFSQLPPAAAVRRADARCPLEAVVEITF